MNPKDFPSEIEQSQLWDEQELELKHLKLIRKVFDDELNGMTRQELLLCDRLVEVLGLDKDRGLYYCKSRALLPKQDQDDLTEIVEIVIEDERLPWYTLPSTTVCIKQLEIFKLHDQQYLKELYFIFDFGWHY